MLTPALLLLVMTLWTLSVQLSFVLFLDYIIVVNQLTWIWNWSSGFWRVILVQSKQLKSGSFANSEDESEFKSFVRFYILFVFSCIIFLTGNYIHPSFIFPYLDDLATFFDNVDGCLVDWWLVYNFFIWFDLWFLFFGNFFRLFYIV